MLILLNILSRTTCPDCGIVLKMGSLRKHQKNMHLKQKNFICDHCDRAFFLKTRLLNHLRSHFQIKPFRCPQCDWRFTSAGALFSHKKKVHEKAYTRCCHLCGKEFSCKTLFDTHMRSSHTGKSFKTKSAIFSTAKLIWKSFSRRTTVPL